MAIQHPEGGEVDAHRAAGLAVNPGDVRLGELVASREGSALRAADPSRGIGGGGAQVVAAAGAGVLAAEDLRFCRDGFGEVHERILPRG